MKIYIAFLLLLVALISCSSGTDPDYDQDIQTLENLYVKEAVEMANYWRVSKPSITSYINADELIFEFPDGRDYRIAQPVEEMYIAIAPYIDQTHTCSTHYISKCQGEMVDKSYHLYISDENSNVLYDDNITTLKNGFFELWLPRDRTLNIQIEYNDMRSDEAISTGEDSQTCITTARLE